jgi:hypothetical protein
MIFRFRNTDETPQTPTEKVLPSDVRYAMQYKEAKLGRSEILDLANNGFSQEGLYLLLKAAVATPTLQREFIEALVAEVSTATLDTDSEQALRVFVAEQVSKLPEEAVVDAMKLAQYSRQGFELWHKKFADAARESASRFNPTYIVGHSMFTGLAAFMSEHTQAQKPLHILLPSWIEDTTEQSCGYVIVDGEVLLLYKDFTREADAIIIDDVKNTGETEQTLTAFWSEQAAGEVPAFQYISSWV